ncbi:hypothetical protein BGZ97_012719 [Linnemannia gamsii]|uniref:FHF complex subunit HOOK-interacting protein C-terminal domain-containing protein n=1 Tax=Linnemannia gamsii TaxID=64522 RepID=A0A9P6RMX0_9FUNG|nr:hypothetical protein BGZ97_012719 [Linnemannia gamsii]
MDSSFWNKLKKTIMTTPKAQPSSALQLTRFNNGWLAIQTAISTAEKRNVSIQQTDIPVRLKNMVDLLVDEESRLDDATGTTGVCMEYLLKHNVLGKLVNLAEKDQPKGLTGETIRTFAGMINLLDDRFLVHNSVHKPTVKLLRTCCGPGTEFEENEDYHEDLVDLMYILCSKIHGYPELLNIFFYDRQWLTVPERVSARRLQKNRETMALLRSISRRSSLALSSMEDDPPTSSSASTFDQKADTNSPKDGDEGDDSEEPLVRPGRLARSMTAASLQGHENHQEAKRDYEFLLFTYLSKFVHREGKSGDFARTGLLFLMELATGSLGEYILDSEFSSYLTAGVGALYSQLPRKLIVKTDPNNLTATSSTSPPPDPKPSRRANIELSTSKDFQSRLDAFLRVLEFCQDVLMRCPNTEIATALLASFKTVFLENILYPSILECSDTDGSSVAVISYIDLILQALEHEALVDLVVGFLMASEEEDTRAKVLEDADAFAEVQNPQTTSPYFMATGRFTLKDLVLSRLKSRSQPTVIATLKLLNTVITRHCKYSLKLLSIQPDHRATSLTEALDMPGQHPYRSVPLINHHAHELDLFFGLIATINPGNTQDIFCCGYESYLRDAEGSIEQHQCLMSNKTPDVEKTTGTISEAELKKQRRRSTKYGNRTNDNMTEDLTAEAVAHSLKKAGEAAALGHAGHSHGSPHPVPMHRLLPSDPLLQILLGTLSHFFAHTVELNLALTGVITSLAVCPYRSLEGWLLFKSSDVKRPNVDRGSEEDSDSGDSQGLHLIDSELDATTLNDSDDEDTLPSYLTRNSTRAGMEFAMPSGPPSFKSFPPFFTMLRTLTQQVDYYRSEIDGFDEYLADRRRTLLGTTIESTANSAVMMATSTGGGSSFDQSHSNSQSGYSMFTSSESFFGSTSDLLGGGGRPSTPTISTSNLPHAAGTTSPRYLGSGGQSGSGSRVTSPAPQRANSKTPVQGSNLSNPVSMVKINSPRARKSSSPSSLMSTPSNMSFLIPPGVGGKRNFKSNSTSPLATSGPRLPSVPTLEIDGQLASPSPLSASSSSQPTSTTTAGPPRSLSPVPLSQPRAIWAAAPTPTQATGPSKVGSGGSSLPNMASSAPSASVPSTVPGNYSHHHQTNLSMSQSQLGNIMGVSNSALAKVMETMMIKPLFPDGFVNDSDSEAETVLDIEAELSDSDKDSENSDDDSSGSGDDVDEDDEDDEDTDEADREVNSDLQEPSREARRRRRKQLRQQQRKLRQQQQQQQQKRVVGGSKGMLASSSQLLQSPAVAKRGVPQQQQQQQEQLVSLGQLLTNVVILEEVVKEVVAVAQVRKGMGIDKVRFL